MKKKIFRDDVLALLGLLVLIGCGGEGSVPVGGQTDSGGLSLIVKSVDRLVPRGELGTISEYRVVVSGPGLNPPREASFSGDAKDAVMEGVPAGKDRTVTVEAFNLRDQMIWKGETGNLIIQSGSTTRAAIDLESIPVFANLTDGGRIENTRLVVRTFSSAAEAVVITDGDSAGKSFLSDAATAVEEILPDVTTGLGITSWWTDQR